MTDSVISQSSINFNNDEAAEFLRISPRTLEKYRSQRRGPAYSKLGTRVVYDLTDLQDYQSKGRCETKDSGASQGATP